MISRIFVRSPNPGRLNFALLTLAILFMGTAQCVIAQEESETSLGDVARTFRKKPASAEAVIDNDNLSRVVDDAAIRRAAGSAPVLSLDPGGKSFHVSSPDVTCSLSFNAKTTSLLAEPVLLDELPRTELAKLDGPATIDGDSLQVSMHNGSTWELREVVIGLTIVNRPQETSATSFGQARLVPTAGSGSQSWSDPYQKQPDVTMLLHVKGSATASATATFRTSLNFALFPDQEWHWAVVKAKGIPPRNPLADVLVQSELGARAVQPVSPVNPPAAIPRLGSESAPVICQPADPSCQAPQ